MFMAARKSCGPWGGFVFWIITLPLWIVIGFALDICFIPFVIIMLPIMFCKWCNKTFNPEEKRKVQEQYEADLLKQRQEAEAKIKLMVEDKKKMYDGAIA